MPPVERIIQPILQYNLVRELTTYLLQIEALLELPAIQELEKAVQPLVLELLQQVWLQISLPGFEAPLSLQRLRSLQHRLTLQVQLWH